ncbi:MAG TPA: haloacid dehalogenase type II [Chitinophagaceae bacterium]|jgi:2-haloacid dehalogenase|nr:haloacid dehalogenase type II [Chitinophagaceae bacterium]
MTKKISRKTFIHTTALATAGVMISSPVYASNTINTKVRAVAFDAFSIFDPRPIFKAVNELVPDFGKQLVDLWQSKQFTYQWLRLSGNRYKNFGDISKDALDFALKQYGLSLTSTKKDFIMANYKTMSAWPDVLPVLEAIKKEGLTICLLSNMTAKMLHQGVQNSGLNNFFDFLISTDEQQTYKPSTNAYQMAVKKLSLKKEEILFVPFAGWDMAGAKWFGYPTFWVNRLKSPIENLDAEPDGIGTTMDELVKFIRGFK